MTRLLTIVLLTSLLFSCATKRKDDVYFIVKHPGPNTQDFGDNVPPPPPPPYSFYGDYNFILIDNFKIYFHTKSGDNNSCMGQLTYNPKPPQIFLTPDNLTEIHIADLPTFLTTSINDSLTTDRHFFASISSPTDTIRNRAFKIITDFLRTKNLMRYVIRNWTEEEQFATTAKIQNIKYDPTAFDWQVGFDTVLIADTTNDK